MWCFIAKGGISAIRQRFFRPAFEWGPSYIPRCSGLRGKPDLPIGPPVFYQKRKGLPHLSGSRPPRPIDGCDGTGRLTPCRAGAVSVRRRLRSGCWTDTPRCALCPLPKQKSRHRRGPLHRCCRSRAHPPGSARICAGVRRSRPRMPREANTCLGCRAAAAAHRRRLDRVQRLPWPSRLAFRLPTPAAAFPKSVRSGLPQLYAGQSLAIGRNLLERDAGYAAQLQHQPAQARY